MTTPWMAAIVLAVGVGAFAVGRGTGYSAGKAAQQAKHDSVAVQELKEIVSSSAQLVVQANQASKTMRSAIKSLVTDQRKSTQELRDVLHGTSDDRLLCRFDADSMHIIRKARDQAAAAAAAGVRSAMPGTTGND